MAQVTSRQLLRVQTVPTGNDEDSGTCCTRASPLARHDQLGQISMDNPDMGSENPTTHSDPIAPWLLRLSTIPPFCSVSFLT